MKPSIPMSPPLRTMTAPELSRLLPWLLLVSAFVSSWACIVASHLVWNETPSMPLGLYWLSERSAVSTGALVAFPVPLPLRELVLERHYLPPGALLVNRVVASRGDRVCARRGLLSVNGEPLGAIPTEDSAGRSLPQYEGCGPVPEGSVFVASHHPKSFDSRTFGLLDARAIRGTVTALWTY